MKAAWYDQNGTARDVLQVGDLDLELTAGPGEVLVRVHASGLNPSDVKRRAGANNQQMDFPRVIPHMDGAGIIAAAGAGVSSDRIGQRVWVFAAQFGRPFGTAAQFVVVPAEQAVALPETASFEEGACLGVPVMTAHRLIFADGPVAGQTVFIAGGAGAVGRYAVQFAHEGGARVLTSVGSSANAAIARDAGADVAFNYRSEDVVAGVRAQTGGAGVDRVVEVDFAANLEIDLGILGANAVLACYGSPSNPNPTIPFYRMMRSGMVLRSVLVYAMPDAAKRAAIADIGRLLAAGKLIHMIDRRFGFLDIVAAHDAVEAGTAQGHVVVPVPH